MTGSEKREVVAPEIPGPFRDCMACAYRDDLPMMGPDNMPLVGKTQSVCRRFPPSIVVVPQQTPEGVAMGMVASLPPVGDGQWCYEFVPENGAEDVTD